MTALEPKTDRDNKGIDSFERAIVYALLLLYKTCKSLSNDSAFFNSVSFNLPSSNTTEASLAGEIILPIDRIEAVELGGNYLESIGIYGSTDPNPLDIDCSGSDSSFMAVVQEPPEVDTLEKYLAWAVNTAKANLVSNGNDTASNLSIQFFNDNPTFPRVRIQVQIPVDYKSYLRQNNLLCSLKPLLTAPVQPYITNHDALRMGNTGLMNNTNRMGNG